MSAGCLPMLIQMPLIIGLFGVMYNPLRYALGIGVGEIETITNIFKEVASASSNSDLSSLVASKANERYYPMYIIQHFSEIKSALVQSGDVSASTIGAIEEFVADKKFELFGLQLGVKPSYKTPNIYWAIPILSGLTSLFQSVLMQAQQKKANPAMASNPASGCMTIFMPLMSVYFTFLFPSGIGVYWIVSNIFSTVQSSVMKKLNGPQREIAKLMIKETAERRSRENSIKRTVDYKK